MKKIKVSLLAIAVVLGAAVSASSEKELFGAQLLSIRTEQSENLGITVTKTAPDSPDFLNTFNFYKDFKSEEGLMRQYGSQIQGTSSQFLANYGNEIISFVDRVSKNYELRNKLPMWPEDNMATIGNVIAYLFPNEANPLTFAKERGVIAENARSQSYMSRKELLDVIAKVFISADRDPAVVLKELGFIESEAQWSTSEKNGFKLVEAIRVVLNIRELIERKNILASKDAYGKKIVPMPQGAAELSLASLVALENAFVTETSRSINTAAVHKELLKKFEKQFSLPLTSELLGKIRKEFFALAKVRVPAVYELPSIQVVGDCFNEVFRKTYMGAVAVTGPLGASIICDQVMVYFPANSYLVNVFSLPKITPKTANEPWQNLARTDVMRSYENALIIDTSGEQKVAVVYAPENLAAKVGRNFELAIGDHEGAELTKLTKAYSDFGVSMKIHLRTITGDNLVVQK